MNIFHFLFGSNSRFAKLFGYYKHTEAVVQPPAPPQTPPEPPKPVISRPIPIHVEGIDFRDANGKRFVYGGFSDFLLYQRYLNNEDIKPILKERAELGANTLRVLGMVDTFSHFYPNEHPDYFDKLGPFVDLLAEYGLMMEFVVFADAQTVMPVVSNQQVHLATVANALRGKPVFLELANEFPKNGVDPLVFIKPDGLLCSRGSGLGDGMPAFPPWDYTTFHCRRDYPKLLLDAQGIELIYGWTNFAGMHQPVVQDEPIGADEVDQPGKRSNDPALFFKIGVLGGLWSGATFHSTDGASSVLLGPKQTQCAKEFFRGLKVVQ